MRSTLKKLKFLVIENIVFFVKPCAVLLPVAFPFTIETFSKDSKSGLASIDSRLSDDNLCYAVFAESSLIHTTWVFKKKLLARQLGYKRALTVGNSVTIPSYRNKGIYTHVLQYIQKDFENKELLIFTHPANLSSIKGIEKSGFKKMYRFKLVRLFGLNLYLKRYDV